jgi:tripartite-type tricarboxylate transporter receptor subunit TctC
MSAELQELLRKAMASPTVRRDRKRSTAMTALRAEAESLMRDEADRAEAAQVLRDMNTLRGR